MDTNTAVTMFYALASGARLEIVKLLVKYGEDGLVAGEVATRLDMRPTNLSFHLKVLVQAGLLHATQEGRYQRYKANLGELMGLVDFLVDECCSFQRSAKTQQQC